MNGANPMEIFKLIGFSHNLESCFTLGTDE